VDILMDYGSNAGCRPVWLDVDVDNQHADCPSRPAGGLIPPTYWLDPGRYTMRQSLPRAAKEANSSGTSQALPALDSVRDADAVLRQARRPACASSIELSVSAAVRVARKPLADRASGALSRIASASLVQQRVLNIWSR